MLYPKIRSEVQRLEHEIKSLNKQLSTLPDGKLVCARNGQSFKWYQSDGHHSQYIPKSNRSFAEKLAIKKYLTVKHQELSQEKQALEFYLRHHHEPILADSLLAPTSPYSQLLTPYFTPDSEEFTAWMNETFDTNNSYPEQKNHKTCAGIYVRSKSEALITTLLHTNKIPFRYECALFLDPVTIYPDFTLRHPHTGEYYYWEHFGLIDTPNYRSKAFSKLQLYASNNIYPTINLITTYETTEHPLDSDYVEHLIQHYFL